MSLLSIAESLSRFHPLIVHLPIGILLFAFFLTLLPAEKRDALSPAMSYALLITAVSAVMAAITGYLLSRSGEYDEALVQKHQWAGIATSVIAVAAMIFRKWQRAAATGLAGDRMGHAPGAMVWRMRSGFSGK